MSGASEAAAALRLAALAAHPAVRAAGTAYTAAHRAFDAATAPGADLMLALHAAPALILAAEALKDAAAQVHADARAAMAALLHDQGITVRTEHHTVFARAGSRTVQILDPAAIPAEFMVQPPPAPDRKALAAALKQGPVPGAALSNGGEPVLTITARKEQFA